jgi:hypothetical protein
MKIWGSGEKGLAPQIFYSRHMMRAAVQQQPQVLQGVLNEKN